MSSNQKTFMNKNETSNADCLQRLFGRLRDNELYVDACDEAADWIESASAEIKATWRAARDAKGQHEAFKIIERMVDRLGYGRTENNPSLVPPNEKS
jgi:hypothetical protein